MEENQNNSAENEPPTKRKLNSRFADYSDDELEQEREKVKKKNTMKSDKKTEKVFLEYLREKWLPDKKVPDLNYWDYSVELLDQILCKYWFEVRQVNGDMYNINSLKS